MPASAPGASAISPASPTSAPSLIPIRVSTNWQTIAVPPTTAARMKMVSSIGLLPAGGDASSAARRVIVTQRVHKPTTGGVTGRIPGPREWGRYARIEGLFVARVAILPVITAHFGPLARSATAQLPCPYLGWE